MRWSAEAVEDLESIVAYIGRDSKHYARSVASEILSVSRAIAEFPQIGHIVPEMGDENIRECLVYRYRLIYRYEEANMLIIAIIHGSRLLENVADRFE